MICVGIKNVPIRIKKSRKVEEWLPKGHSTADKIIDEKTLQRASHTVSKFVFNNVAQASTVTTFFTILI